MDMLSFNVLDDLKEAQQVLANYLQAPDTKEKIEQAIDCSIFSLVSGACK